MDYERFFLENLPVLDSAVRTVARRHGLGPDAAEELNAAVRLKVVDQNYAVLKKFEGRSTIRTFYTTIIEHLLLDRRNAQYGKWRPSAQARRLGPVAIMLDQLISRDGRSFDEAVPLLQQRFGTEISAADLHAILVQLPVRHGRRFVGHEALDQLASPNVDESSVVRELDGANFASRVEWALQVALGRLQPQDRLLLKLRFSDDIKIVRISQLLGLEQKALYRRFDTVLQVMRRAMEEAGIRHGEVTDFVQDRVPDLPTTLFGPAPGAAAVRTDIDIVAEDRRREGA